MIHGTTTSKWFKEYILIYKFIEIFQYKLSLCSYFTCARCITQTEKISNYSKNGARLVPLASPALLLMQRTQHSFWRRYCSTLKQNLFLATKRDIKICNDSSQQALNWSLNPNPSMKKITVIMLPRVKQTFLQNYRYSKRVNEHLSCFWLWKSILPLLWARPQRSDRKPLPIQEVLSTYTPLSYPRTSAPSAGTNPYQKEWGQEKIFLKANLIINYWGEWQFWLSYLYTVIPCTAAYVENRKCLLYWVFHIKASARHTLILWDHLLQSNIFQCFSSEW